MAKTKNTIILSVVVQLNFAKLTSKNISFVKTATEKGLLMTLLSNQTPGNLVSAYINAEKLKRKTPNGQLLGLTAKFQ